MTGEQIKNGLENWQEAWPPSAPEFKKACLGKGIKKGLSHNTAAYMPFKKGVALEKLPNPEIAKKHRDELKKILNK